MEFLLDITLKSTLILLFSGLILLCLKKASATLRHWIISLTMMGLLLLPLLVALVPDMEVTIPYLPPSEIVVEVEAHIDIPLQVDEPLENVVTMVPVMEELTKKTQVESIKVLDSQADMFVESVENRSDAKPISFSKILPLIWLFGFGFFLLKFCFGLLGLIKITINSPTFGLPSELEKYANFYTKRQVQFLMNSTIKTPMTWGGFRPVILLPDTAKSWSTEELRTVLIHELNHIKRNDYWVHTLGLLSVCFYWCNPLIWLMKRQQLLEREKACDEAVLRAGIRQHNYAEQLVNIARQLSVKQSMISENALPMAKMSHTKARVLAILNFDNDKFQFSVWKQRNWGLLYVFLFPILAAFSPVGKELIKGNVELPKLDNITQFLKTDELQNEPIGSNFLPSTIPNFNDSAQPMLKDDLYEEQEAFYSNRKENQSVENLLNLEFTLPTKLLEETIKLPKRTIKKGLYGQWKEGKSEFKIWTYGEFKMTPTAPYIEVVSDDGIVFIEEYIDGLFKGKINQLTITKAPYDCRKKPVYDKAVDMRPNALIKKGMPIKIWSKNSNYEKWIKAKGLKIAGILNGKRTTDYIKEVDETDRDWSNRIERMPDWIEMNFIGEKEVKADFVRKQRVKAIKLNNIPYYNHQLKEGARKTHLIGHTSFSGNHSGYFDVSPIGYRHMMVLKGNKLPSLIKDFNFHLSENDFKNLAFELSLYNVEDEKIKYTITKNPIPINVKEGNGWISKDLRPYNIVTKGDVLIVLEIKGYTGSKRKKELYFSRPETNEQYQPLVDNRENKNWKAKIWEYEHTMYLNVETPIETQEDNNSESGYLIKFQKGKSNYKIWTYGDFKTHQMAPYIEVISPDGVVIVEETTDKAIGSKTCRFIITKSPHDGIFVQNFKDGVINDFKLIEKNIPLYLLPTKKDWVFLRTDGDEWMSENLPNVFWELGRLIRGNSDFQPTTEKDLEWWSVIQNHQAMKAKRFVELKPDLKISGTPGMLPFSAIPFKAIHPKKLRGVNKKIGRTKATHTMTGSSGGEMKGSRFGTLLKGNNQKGILQDFNLNIQKHKFKSLTFDCYFFKVKNNEIQHAFNEKPVRIEIDEKTGWSSHDLTQHKIGIEGDVLVVLEVADYTAEQTELFFAQAPTHFMYKPKDKFYQGQKLEFWDSAFAMYMTVRQ